MVITDDFLKISLNIHSYYNTLPFTKSGAHNDQLKKLRKDYPTMT